MSQIAHDVPPAASAQGGSRRISLDPGDQPKPAPDRPRRHIAPRVFGGIVGVGDAATLVLTTLACMAALPDLRAAPAPAAVTIVLFLLTAVTFGAYTASSHAVSWLSGASLWLAAGVAVGLAGYATEWLTGSRIPALDTPSYTAWIATAGGALVVWRLWMKRCHAAWQSAGRMTYRLAVIGMSPAARRLVAAIDRLGDPAAISVRRVFDDNPSDTVMDIRYGGQVDNLLTPRESCRIDGVIVALPWDDPDLIVSVSARLRELAADVWLMPEPGSPAELLPGTHLVPGARVLSLSPAPLRGWRGIIKRAEDVVLSSLILLIAAPVMVVCAALVACTSPGPVMIRQPRFGYGNVPFLVLKFRTMYYDPADLSGMRATVRGDKRVTRVGRVLRATSLDELPQLLNVLRGDMSLVGPRPHPVDMLVEGRYYDEIVPFYLTRHRVKPGITGLAQINGYRGLVDTREKAVKRLEYDLFYIENWSLRLDLKILLQTLVKGFTGSGAF